MEQKESKEQKQESVEEVCRKHDYFRKNDEKGTYCLLHGADCPYYDKDKTITVKEPSFGFGNTEKYSTFHLCKRTD